MTETTAAATTMTGEAGPFVTAGEAGPSLSPKAGLGWGDWLREGLRAAVFLRPRTGAAQPAPLQLLAVLGFAAAIQLGLGRLAVNGDASFDLRGWLVPWWSTGAVVLLFWCLQGSARPPGGQPAHGGVAAWVALWAVAELPLHLVSSVFEIAAAYDATPEAFTRSAALAWGLWLGLWAWMLGIAMRLGWNLGLGAARVAALGAGVLAISALLMWKFSDRAWEPVYVPEPDEPRLMLDQQVFEAQQALWQQSVQALGAQRPGVADVYGIVFAPYAAEDVFLRESAMVAQVLAQRFDAEGRVLRLVNHATTAASLPWATPLNLQRAIAAVAQRMDPEEDILVVYLSSHGAQDFALAAAHHPLEVAPVSPSELRTALDEAGVRHRVIAVSACYSGGWVGPLASESTLVMTAADRDHTSYGCGRLSELTYFGRAVFDEQLRGTRSFEQAFAAAVPVIRQREEQAGKPDGFSNPQISVGERIRPVLDALAKRLDTGTGP